jgi:triphosphoribosyl-dephospho-CoA synthase
MVRQSVRAAGEIQELVMNETSAPIRSFAARTLSALELADVAVWALREEVLLTPKPALVDRRGNGAHRDMDLPLLLRSAVVLKPMFVRVAEAAMKLPPGTPLRERLGRIGRDGEAAMLAATGGINTHRGAIWSLGLLCAAAASAGRACDDAAAICERAGRLARLPACASATPSHGRAAFLRHGARGARGEAEDGFPHVHDVALPALRSARCHGSSEADARLQALIALIARVDDTCLLHRGGRSALDAAQRGARAVLDAGVETVRGKAALHELERELLERNASPGGCADLLAATLYVDRLAPEECPYGNT